jgi:hypothetical protein
MYPRRLNPAARLMAQEWILPGWCWPPWEVLILAGPSQDRARSKGATNPLNASFGLLPGTAQRLPSERRQHRQLDDSLVAGARVLARIEALEKLVHADVEAVASHAVQHLTALLEGHLLNDWFGVDMDVHEVGPLLLVVCIGDMKVSIGLERAFASLVGSAP